MDQDEDLLSLIRRSGDPTILELLELLTTAKRIPKFSVSSQVRGYGDYNPVDNHVRIHPTGGSTNTVAHELSHAADTTMEKQWYEDNRYHKHQESRERNLGPKLNEWLGGGVDPMIQQWLKAYEKLDPTRTKLPLDGLSNYRSSADELRAFGVGNTVDKGNPNKFLGYNANPHLDATMATEAAILRDMFMRRIKHKPK